MATQLPLPLTEPPVKPDRQEPTDPPDVPPGDPGPPPGDPEGGGGGTDPSGGTGPTPPGDPQRKYLRLFGDLRRAAERELRALRRSREP